MTRPTRKCLHSRLPPRWHILTGIQRRALQHHGPRASRLFISRTRKHFIASTSPGAGNAECDAPPSRLRDAFSPITNHFSSHLLRHGVRRNSARLRRGTRSRSDSAPIFQGLETDTHDDELAGDKG